MPFYHKLGKIPHKRHTVFKKPDGGIYYEQLFGTEGFSGMASLLYHIHRPTQVKEIKGSKDISPNIAIDANLQSFNFKGFKVKPVEDYRSEEHTSELQSRFDLVCRLLLEKKKNKNNMNYIKLK